MYRKVFIIIFCSTFFGYKIFAQCSTLGQTPATAFPVCGTTSFNQTIVPICTNGNLYVPGCSGRDGINYVDKNPFWYKFTCFASGTFGFAITPLDPKDDYDWQLFDVTGQNPNAVFTNNNLVIASNWSARPNTTGTSSNASNQYVCATTNNYNGPNFSRYPNLILGHNYLLMVSHFDDSQQGYSLSFGGGTAVITDPLEPRLASAVAPCDGTEIRIKTNKKMKCNSLAADGSDFTVTTPTGAIINAIGASSVQCGAGFDLDSLSIFLPTPLTPGLYRVKAKTGTDGNTLKDNCDRLIPVGDSVNFTVFPLVPTPLDSLTTPKCAPQTLELVFKKKIKCSSIDAGGGDFFITGTYPVNVTSVSANCIDGKADRIILNLSAPLQVKGSFFVNLQVGPDGNTLLDECDLETPLPDDVAFNIKDTVNADFGQTINYTCAVNTIAYTHNGANEVNLWNWTFEPFQESFLQNPTISYTDFRANTTSLIVSNGVCYDTATVQIIFANYIKANFKVSSLVCPEKKAEFKNTSLTNSIITDYQWTFRNGFITNVKDPSPQSYVPLIQSDYTALPQLIIKNDFGCFDTITKPVQIVYSCFIAVPSAFTPNGDGLNDYLYPLKAYKSTNMNFSIYNRLGQRVFYSHDWQNKWDGKYKGLPQDPGAFVWTLDYINSESGQHVIQKGTSILIR